MHCPARKNADGDVLVPIRSGTMKAGPPFLAPLDPALSPNRLYYERIVGRVRFLFLGLIGAGLLASPAMAASHDTTGHTPSAAAGGDPASKFDQKAALAISQGAIGKSLGDYTLTAADGRNLRMSEFRGKPLVISLIYTSCYHICPTTTQHLAKVVDFQ